MPSRSTVRLWLPAFLWTAVIFAASSASFSSSNTGGFLEKLIHTIAGGRINPTVIEVLHFMIRKLSHVAEYGILGILVYRAVRAERPGRDIRWALAAILFAAVVGSLDELHQAFVPSRTATVWDTVIDTLGATLAVLFFR
ncbi:MAG: VanZ family protein [Acidobacteriota bacterium]|nr:VanZ family protein [Acidobacteriota bacterium]